MDPIVHNPRVPDFQEQVDQLAGLIEEFGLTEAALTLEGFLVSFKRSPQIDPALGCDPELSLVPQEFAHPTHQPALFPEPSRPAGTPIASPMPGIFYASPSPSSPPFVRVGDTVSAGQTVALIEAMKVFNEIPSPVSGTVLEFVAEPGSVVQPGDVLLYVG